MSKGQSKTLSRYYAGQSKPFFITTVEHRKVIFTRIAVSKTNESRIAVPRSAEQVLSDLCKAVAKSLTLIRDYRVKRKEMLLAIDPDSLMSD